MWRSKKESPPSVRGQGWVCWWVLAVKDSSLPVDGYVVCEAIKISISRVMTKPPRTVKALSPTGTQSLRGIPVRSRMWIASTLTLVQGCRVGPRPRVADFVVFLAPLASVRLQSPAVSVCKSFMMEMSLLQLLDFRFHHRSDCSAILAVRVGTSVPGTDSSW